MKTIEDFKNLFPGGTGLWIGSGPSSGELQHKHHEWFDRYDFVVVANGAFQGFEFRPLHTKPKWFWICIESSGFKCDWFWEVPRSFIQIVHHLNFEFANKGKRAKFMDGIMIPANRNKHGDAFNPREYDLGLHSGPVDEHGIARGTVTLQVMHLAAFMGAKHLDMIGCEFCAVNGVWHFYENTGEALARYSGASQKLLRRIKMKDGKVWLTHEHFIGSAPYIDEIYEKKFIPAGMTCTRFCGGLLKKIPEKELPK